MLVHRQDANIIFFLWHGVIFVLSVLLLSVPLFALSYLCLNPNVYYLTWPLTEASLQKALPQLEYQIPGVLFAAAWLAAFYTGVSWLFSLRTYVDFRIVRFLIRRLTTWYLPGFLWVGLGMWFIGLPEPVPLVANHIIQDEASQWTGTKLGRLRWELRDEPKVGPIQEAWQVELERLVKESPYETERVAAKEQLDHERAVDRWSWKRKGPEPKLPEKENPRVFFAENWMQLPYGLSVIAFWWMLGLTLLDAIRIQWRRAKGRYSNVGPFRSTLGDGIRDDDIDADLWG